MTNVNLSGQQRRKLRDALIGAFPERSSLEELLDFELDKKLNQITQDSNLKTVVYQLIETAQAQGWLVELVRAAHQENPGNPELAAIALELLSNHQNRNYLLVVFISAVLVASITAGTAFWWVPILISQFTSVPSQKTPAPMPESPALSPEAPTPSPIQFMENYYNNINIKQFDKAWEMLTPQFQEQDPKSSYLGFKKWWSSVDKVDIQSISLVSQTDNMAIVTVQTAYVFGDHYRKERPQQFTLIWNSKIENWQINSRVFIAS